MYLLISRAYMMAAGKTLHWNRRGWGRQWVWVDVRQCTYSCASNAWVQEKCQIFPPQCETSSQRWSIFHLSRVCSSLIWYQHDITVISWEHYLSFLPRTRVAELPEANVALIGDELHCHGCSNSMPTCWKHDVAVLKSHWVFLDWGETLFLASPKYEKL